MGVHSADFVTSLVSGVRTITTPSVTGLGIDRGVKARHSEDSLRTDQFPSFDCVSTVCKEQHWLTSAHRHSRLPSQTTLDN